MEFIKKIKYIFFVQVVTITVLVLIFTVIRIFFPVEYKKLCDDFVSIASYDTDISLVLEEDKS